MKKQSRNEKGSYSLIGISIPATPIPVKVKTKYAKAPAIERCKSEIQSRRRFFIIFFEGCNAVQSDYNHMVTLTLMLPYMQKYSILV